MPQIVEKIPLSKAVISLTEWKGEQNKNYQINWKSIYKVLSREQIQMTFNAW